MADIVTLSAEERELVAAFWWQPVYFDGVPLRRWEVVPRLADTPGMTEAAALSLLVSAAPVGEPAVTFAAGSIDPEGNWITISHQHVHTDKSGAIDAGGSPHMRKLLGQQTVGDRVRGAVGKVGKIAKKIRRAASRADEGLTNAVERGSDKAYDFIKQKGKQALPGAAAAGRAAVAKGKAAVQRGKELAKKYGPIAGKGAAKVGVASAKKVGGAIKSGLSFLWKKLKDRVTGAPRTIEGKIKAIKGQIRQKRLEGKLDRLTKMLAGDKSSKASPAPAKTSKPAKAEKPAKSGSDSDGGPVKGFRERMAAAKAAKAAKNGKKKK